MAQTRIFNFGDTATQAKIKTAFQKLLPSLVYEGCDLSISGVTTVTIASGSLLLPDGVLVSEDSAVTISVPITGAAEDFTIVCTHVDEAIIGGAGATYSAVSGFLSSYTNSTILGWIHYPGGGIPLASSMLVQAPKGPFDAFSPITTNQAPILFSSPLQSVKVLSDPIWISSTSAYSAIPTPDIREEIAIIAGAPVSETATHYFQIRSKANPPVAIKIRHNTPTTLGTDITIDVYDTTGSLVTSTAIVGTGVWETSTVTLDTTSFTFTEGETFSVQMTITGAAGGGDTILIKWVEFTFNPTP